MTTNERNTLAEETKNDMTAIILSLVTIAGMVIALISM